MRIYHLKYLFVIFGLVGVLAACSAFSPTKSGNDNAPLLAAEDESEQAKPVGAENEAEQRETSENLLASIEPVEIERDPDVPSLPFSDNTDPTLCGLPKQWGSDEPAYLTGLYEGEMVQPTVFLYDSHFRRKIVARAPHGTEVRILLSQSNPDVDYFMVKIFGSEPPNEGWVPAPFLSFEPVIHVTENK